MPDFSCVILATEPSFGSAEYGHTKRACTTLAGAGASQILVVSPEVPPRRRTPRLPISYLTAGNRDPIPMDRLQRKLRPSVTSVVSIGWYPELRMEIIQHLVRTARQTGTVVYPEVQPKAAAKRIVASIFALPLRLSPPLTQALANTPLHSISHQMFIQAIRHTGLDVRATRGPDVFDLVPARASLRYAKLVKAVRRL